MAEIDLFGNDCSEMYIAKFHYSYPYNWGVICAVHISKKSKYIVERYVVLNKSSKSKSGVIEYPPVNIAISSNVKENKINLAEDVNIITQVMSSKITRKNKISPYIDMSKPVYTCKDLEKDLNHRFELDIAEYSTLFKNGFNKLAKKTNCKKLKEDIAKFNL